MKGGNEMSNQIQQKTILFTIGRAGYPVTRCIQIAKLLASHRILFAAPEKQTVVLQKLDQQGFAPLSYARKADLKKLLQEYEPDVVISDGCDTDIDEGKLLSSLVPVTLHFDDFGEGGKAATRVVHSLYHEDREPVPSHYVVGPSAFVVPDELEPYANSGLKTAPALPLPHVVVTFADDDADNLSYRTLRHLLHLQIPLAITVALHSSYPHSRDDLKLMALGRKQTRIVDCDDPIQLISESDLVICDASYTPYFVAVIGKPCIVVAEDEKEAQHAFPKEANGFIYLGLGRKLKQSHLQNAVMETILHPNRSVRAIKKQLSLKLSLNNSNMQRFLEKIIQEEAREITK
jgi:spore coat polysaccharide biosynthesis predicted glycosyltransferase SpsG